MLFFHTKDHLDKHSTSEQKEFIKPRIRLMNDAWVFPTLVWYEVSGFREIEESMGINNLFTCVILQKNDEFINYSYVLSLRESIDSYVLIVDEKREGDFVRPGTS